MYGLKIAAKLCHLMVFSCCRFNPESRLLTSRLPKMQGRQSSALAKWSDAFRLPEEMASCEQLKYLFTQVSFYWICCLLKQAKVCRLWWDNLETESYPLLDLRMNDMRETLFKGKWFFPLKHLGKNMERILVCVFLITDVLLSFIWI